MNKNQKPIQLIFSLLALASVNSIFAKVKVQQNDFEYAISGKFRSEFFGGKNISLLNNNNDADKIAYMRHTFDVGLNVLYGMESFLSPVVEFVCGIRNKGVWGNPETIARTTEATIKDLETVGGEHRHAVPRHLLWIRELWLDINLQKAFGLGLWDNEFSFRIGAFPFQLGRGIALGDAYAVGPELLGFYTDSIVDQYAFGGKLSGGLINNVLNYDLYAALLQNRSSSLGETAAKIFGQEYGRLETPARGFGSVNYAIAGRLIWKVFNNDQFGAFTIEPYALYNSDPEQSVEFIGDAIGKLGTVGMAGEYIGQSFEFGFDWAVNLGYQKVKGWDRNEIVKENRNGQVFIVNSHVVDGQGQKALFIPANQGVINQSMRDETQNGQEIGIVNGTSLKNANDRFRNGYTNTYRGWMVVADAAYWIYKHDLQVAMTAGIASGDENPNLITKDGVYSGFIPLQEVYDGKRVRSAFLLGSAGKLNRPLSMPTEIQAASRFASTVSGFTNLVFVGGGATWIPEDLESRLKVNPNIMAFWQEKPTNKFDVQTRTVLEERASAYLGLEGNVFVDYYLLADLKLFLVGSIFFAGRHFTDIKGQPLSRDQDRALDRLDKTGFSADRIPNLGDDNAYTLNIGLEYRF